MLFLTAPTKERYCIGFTLRDSVDWFINATCWGEKAAINNISACFKIGEVGKFFMLFLICKNDQAYANLTCDDS